MVHTARLEPRARAPQLVAPRRLGHLVVLSDPYPTEGLPLLSEADSCCVRSEADSESIRGRPPVFSDEVLGQAARYSYARRIRTRRGAQDLVYRMFAIAALEHFCEAYPEKEMTLAWLLTPKRRHTLLTELGRVAQPRSDAAGGLSWSEPDVSRLIRAALTVAQARPSTKVGVAMIRDFRRHGGAWAWHLLPRGSVGDEPRDD